MSDKRLRELERRWRETNAISDEVALIRERLRGNRIFKSQTETAAMLGSEAARHVCPSVQELGAWSPAFLLCGASFCGQAVLAAMEMIGKLINAYAPDDQLAIEAINLCQAYQEGATPKLRTQIDACIERVDLATQSPYPVELDKMWKALFDLCTWVLESPEDQVLWWAVEQGSLFRDPQLKRVTWEAVQEALIPQLLGHA